MVNKSTKNSRLRMIENKVSLSHCALKYAVAISNPFSPDAMGSCVPLGQARYTQKVSSFVRFDITVGTQGVGFALITPTLSNLGPIAWVTSSGFTGTTANFTPNSILGTSTPGVSGIAMPNLPYTTTQLTDDNIGVSSVSGRIVSCGAIAHYTGTTLNQSGLIYCLADPSHANLFGSSAASLGARSETCVENLSRKKCLVTTYAVDESEYEFGATGGSGTFAQTLQNVCPFSKGASILSGTTLPEHAAAPMIIFISGAVPGSSIHVEIAQHAEYNGPLTEGKGTPSHMDPVGTAKVQASAARATALKAAKNPRSFGTLLYDSLFDTAKELLPVGITAAKAALTAAFL